ncbi:EF-hand domain-containing protein [Streptomyces sp. NPDC048639]|uniref:EF-hand domain-containing protein n=1 Tax=Streptomyces sp. NPDC048639 TaxID=3365581 RepID=UPI003714EA8F
MDPAEYQAKIARRFATFDQDGNGYISREDFNAAAAAVLAEFDVTARSMKGQALYEGAEAFWQGMAAIADTDGDQHVTREEFVNGAVKRLSDNAKRFAEIARPFLRSVIRIADTDGDGVITPEEAERVVRSLGVPSDVCAMVAAALDDNGDGKITEEEIIAAFALYFTTPEPTA